MTDKPYKHNLDQARQQLKQVFEAAKDELARLLSTREEIDKKIREVQADIVELGPLCGEEVDDPILQFGLTDAIRYVLSTNDPLTALEIRKKLLEAGFELTGANQMAGIHAVLRRLEKSDEARCNRPTGSNVSERQTWEWISEHTPPRPRIGEWVRTEFPDTWERFLKDIRAARAAIRKSGEATAALEKGMKEGQAAEEE